VHIEIPISYINIKLICVHPYMHTYVIFKGKRYTKLNSSTFFLGIKAEERKLCGLKSMEKSIRPEIVAFVYNKKTHKQHHI
jgi:hypothetical protein